MVESTRATVATFDTDSCEQEHGFLKAMRFANVNVGRSNRLTRLDPDRGGLSRVGDTSLRQLEVVFENHLGR